MRRDNRDTQLYREIEALCETLRAPGTGQISDAAEVHAAPDGKSAVFAGTVMEKLEGAPATRICQVDMQSGDCRVLSFGPNTDRLPKYSPRGGQIAFLSDRHAEGDFQLYLLDPASGAARPAPRVEGWVEYFHWLADGNRILLGVAGHGADVAGAQGAIASKRAATDVPSWMPRVESGDESCRWRSAWIYELAERSVRQVSSADTNIWEAVWCGANALAAVVSDGPSEGLWYTARLQIIATDGRAARDIFTPRDQLGWPAASPSGDLIAVAEAVCSDRWIVAGELRLIETATGHVRSIDTHGVDITTAEWRCERALLLAGLRGFETVIGVYDAVADVFTEVWASRDLSTAGASINVSAIGENGDCVLVGESFMRSPHIAAIRRGEYRLVKSFDLGYEEQVRAIASVECETWTAPDGLEIQGWLLRPEGAGPHPLVMNVHGGPVANSRPAWLGRPRGLPLLMLVRRGYAVFLPNARGSSGRGQEFARHVLGDMGGADTHDHLSGLDHLVARGLADPKRLGVMGASYGGYMTAWLITQDSRFAAAVAVAPVTNQVTEHLISNIPHFVKLFLADSYTNSGGKYFTRSPIMHAHKVRTPTLNICGALDRCTPPEEAMQFHQALLENGVESVLVTYPEEGHGVRKYPAAIDYCARVLGWFEEHMHEHGRID